MKMLAHGVHGVLTFMYQTSHTQWYGILAIFKTNFHSVAYTMQIAYNMTFNVPTISCLTMLTNVHLYVYDQIVEIIPKSVSQMF